MFRFSAIALAGALFFASATASFTISGAVLKSGSYDSKSGLRLRQVVEQAGIAKNADLKRITLEQDGEKKIVDISKLGPTPLVLDGAKIVVPEFDSSRYIGIRGAVGKPGYYEYGNGISIREALAEALPFKDARMDSVRITRTLANGKTQITRVDLKDVNANTSLMPGDIVEVAYPGVDAMSDKELLTIVVIGLLILLLIR